MLHIEKKHIAYRRWPELTNRVMETPKRSWTNFDVSSNAQVAASRFDLLRPQLQHEHANFVYILFSPLNHLDWKMKKLYHFVVLFIRSEQYQGKAVWIQHAKQRETKRSSPIKKSVPYPTSYIKMVACMYHGHWLAQICSCQGNSTRSKLGVLGRVEHKNRGDTVAAKWESPWEDTRIGWRGSASEWIPLATMESGGGGETAAMVEGDRQRRVDPTVCAWSSDTHVTIFRFAEHVPVSPDTSPS
jgi:hypothetical protein